MGWMTEIKQELSRNFAGEIQQLSAEIWCVFAFVVCLSHLPFPECFYFLHPGAKRTTGETTPLHAHTHTHTNLFTQTYPSSTAATQQMWQAGLNFLAPRLSPSLMHFSSPPSCSYLLPLHNGIDWRLSHQTVIKRLIF